MVFTTAHVIHESHVIRETHENRETHESRVSRVNHENHGSRGSRGSRGNRVSHVSHVIRVSHENSAKRRRHQYCAGQTLLHQPLPACRFPCPVRTPVQPHVSRETAEEFW